MKKKSIKEMNKSLKKSGEEGDKIIVDLNKNEINCKELLDESEYHKRKEEFLPYALLALFLLTLSFVLKSTFTICFFKSK